MYGEGLSLVCEYTVIKDRYNSGKSWLKLKFDPYQKSVGLIIVVNHVCNCTLIF